MEAIRCSSCGHETAGRRKIRPDLCGPCYSGKPVGWWDDLPAVLAKLGMPAALLAWGLAGGGGGCSGTPPPSPVLIPFQCPATFSQQHWAYEDRHGSGDFEQFGDASVWDCEWNGANDAGPYDVDESDPTGSPRANWDYRIEPDGSYSNFSSVWNQHLPTTGLDVYTTGILQFPVQVGLVYTVAIQQGKTENVAQDTSAKVRCGGAVVAEWPASPQWEAQATETCLFDYRFACSQPSGPQDIGDCSDVARIVR